MLTIEILAIGKTKEAWLEKTIQSYEKRLKGKILISWTYFKKDQDLLLRVKTSPFPVALNPSGKLFTTEEFSSWLKRSLENSKGIITFIIGGPEGLPKDLKPRFSLSLSPLTLTHQMVRLLLTEQIYRSYTLWSGHPYHKS